MLSLERRLRRTNGTNRRDIDVVELCVLIDTSRRIVVLVVLLWKVSLLGSLLVHLRLLAVWWVLGCWRGSLAVHWCGCRWIGGSGEVGSGGLLVLLLTAKDEEHYGADEGETEQWTDYHACNPCLTRCHCWSGSRCCAGVGCL